MVSVLVCYLFYQPMDEKIKTWPLSFPVKENPDMEKVLFDWPIVLQYDVKAKYRLISWKLSGIKFFSPEHSLNQPKKTSRICIHSINQSGTSTSVQLLLLFCSHIFMSRSYENHCNWCYCYREFLDVTNGNNRKTMVSVTSRQTAVYSVID